MRKYLLPLAVALAVMAPLVAIDTATAQHRDDWKSSTACTSRNHGRFIIPFGRGLQHRYWAETDNNMPAEDELWPHCRPFNRRAERSAQIAHAYQSTKGEASNNFVDVWLAVPCIRPIGQCRNWRATHGEWLMRDLPDGPKMVIEVFSRKRIP